jgi:hypothetical protein
MQILSVNSFARWLPCSGITAMRVKQKQSESHCKDSSGSQGPRLAGSPRQQMLKLLCVSSWSDKSVTNDSYDNLGPWHGGAEGMLG